MKVTTQNLGDRQIEMAIEVEDSRVQEALQRTARKIAGQINIPGFRKGKAPYAIVVRTVGEDTLYQETLDAMTPQLLKEALAEADLVPYRPGEMRDLQWKPLSFKVTWALPPVVDLGDYRALRVPYPEPVVSDDDVLGVLESVRQRNTVLEPAGEGPAEWGQLAILDVTATLADGSSLDLSEVKNDKGNISVLLNEQRESLLPGFSAHVVGVTVGQETHFGLVVPDDFDDENLRGQTLTMTVQLNDLKKVIVPPLDDTLAQTVGNYESLDQLRASVRQRLEHDARLQAEAAFVEACVARLTEAATIEFPPVVVEEELDKWLEETNERLREQKLSLEEMLKIKKQTREQYRDEMRPRAVQRVRQGLAISHFAQIEGLIQDEDEDEDDANEKLLAQVLDRLVAICKGEFSETAEGEPAEPAPA